MLEQIFTITFFTAFLAAAVRMAVPLIYAALGEVFLEKTGILNIGLEGVMLGERSVLLQGHFIVKVYSLDFYVECWEDVWSALSMDFCVYICHRISL